MKKESDFYILSIAITGAIVALIVLLLIILYGRANAALYERGGGLIYCDALDITFLQYENKEAPGPREANWVGAKEFATEFTYYDPARKVNMTDWRLPTVQYAKRQQGYNNIVHSELGYIYYTELENKGAFDINGNELAVSEVGLKNTGPIESFVESWLDPSDPEGKCYIERLYYWCETINWPDRDPDVPYIHPSNLKWAPVFFISTGLLASDYKGSDFGYEYTWLVHDGDVGATPTKHTPLPPSALFFICGLMGLVWMKRRK